MPALVPSPFLHREPDRVYNPLSHRTLVPGEALREAFWAVPDGTDLSRRFHLRCVSLEARGKLRDACCSRPASVGPRKPVFTPTASPERPVAGRPHPPALRLRA